MQRGAYARCFVGWPIVVVWLKQIATNYPTQMPRPHCRDNANVMMIKLTCVLSHVFAETHEFGANLFLKIETKSNLTINLSYL